MRKLFQSWAITAAVVFALSVPALAQDPVKVAPEMHKVLVDTNGVRMYIATFEPGSVISTHYHPFHVVYVLQGGELTITDEKGKVTKMAAKEGDAFPGAETVHITKNTGATTVKALVVEVAGKK
ncbi:MAG TPA: cupin domain-containing protein [Chitinophagales bacterium]|nr:cupin domain-containing protein [Chitinophagales bacterium]